MMKLPRRGAFRSKQADPVSPLIILALALFVPNGCLEPRQPQPWERASSGLPIGRWTLGPDHSTARITFSFPPPHADYSGEVRAALGWIEIASEGRMSGRFTVRACDVDMGEPDLTQNVCLAAEMLHGEAFPEISFQFENAKSESERNELLLNGVFRLKGAEVPLSASANIAFVEGFASRSDLHLSGAFQLHDLRSRFNISGPGAEDDPAANTLRFTFDFVLVPSPASTAP